MPKKAYVQPQSIRELLRLKGDNKFKTAELMGISDSALHDYLKQDRAPVNVDKLAAYIAAETRHGTPNAGEKKHLLVVRAHTDELELIKIFLKGLNERGTRYVEFVD